MNVCSICTNPRREEIDQALLAPDRKVWKVAKDFELSEPSLYRHARKHVHAAGDSEVKDLASNAPVSASERDLASIVSSAKRLVRKAEKAKDLRDIKGAIEAATKAIAEWGKARGEIKVGGNINVTANAVAAAAVEQRERIANLTPAQAADAAKAILATQLDARDPHAKRIVLELVRMIPDGEVGQVDRVELNTGA